MKRAILTAVIYAALAVLATAVLIGSLVLLLAIPDILHWVAGYIGTTPTWILFIFIIGAVIARCIAE